MKCYIVTLEANDAQVRQKVSEQLQTYTHFCPVHRYCWAIMSDQTAVQIRDNVVELLGPADRVFIVRSGTAAAWQNSYGPEHDAWLKKYL